MKKTLLLFFVFSFTNSIVTYSQLDNKGSKSLAMGGIFTTLDDFWSSMYNQAGLANIEKLTIGLGYDNSFLMKELATKHIGIAIPTKKSGVFGISLKQYGFSLYNLNKIGAAYSMKLSPKLSAGIMLDYIHLQLGDIYGSTGTFTFEMGAQYKINDQWTTGIHFFNPIMSKLADYHDERLTSTISLGCSFKASNQLLLTTEIQKSIEHKPDIKFGIDYKIVPSISLRSGISTNPGIYSFGLGFNYNNFIIDFSGNFHQLLGFSPSSSLIYVFK